jgi:hypothetical protein
MNVFQGEDGQYKNVPGPARYKGRTIITSPDGVENQCHYRLYDKKKLAHGYHCRNIQYFKDYPEQFLQEQPKEYFDKNKMYFRGKPVKSWKKLVVGREQRQYVGKINQTQLQILKVFFEKKSKVITDKKFKYKHVILNAPYFVLTQYDPYILDTLIKWGILKDNWWNCRKFVNYFHKKPEVLLEYIKSSTTILPTKKATQCKKRKRSKSRGSRKK